MTISETAVRVKQLSPASVLPKQEGSGYILYANEHIVLKAHSKHLMPTGLSMVIPLNYYGQLHLIKEHVGIFRLFGGVIDSDYRGQIHAIIYNMTDGDQTIAVGDEICKIVFVKINTDNLVVVNELDESVRGEAGFGSTGK